MKPLRSFVKVTDFITLGFLVHSYLLLPFFPICSPAALCFS